MSQTLLKKRFLINMALLATVALLIIAIIFTPEKEENIVTQLTNADRESVKRIHIKRSGKNDIILKKLNSVWMLEQPFASYANEFRVKSILNLLSEKSEKQLNVEKLNTSEFGLNQPLVVVFFDSIVIRIGDLEHLSEKRYVQLGNTIHLCADNYLGLLTSDVDSFVEARILPSQQKTISFKLPNFTILSDDSGKWKIDPEDAALSADDLQEWVDQWRYSQATHVEKMKNFKIESQPAFIATFNDNTSIEYLIVDDNDTWQGFYNPEFKLAYHMSARTLKGLLNKPKPSVVEQDKTGKQ